MPSPRRYSRRSRCSTSPASPTAPLVLGDEPAGAALRHDTLQVGVPPLRHVALRRHESMLARRMQHGVAERAHVAGRLEALRRTQCPPAGFHDAHGAATTVSCAFLFSTTAAN